MESGDVFEGLHFVLDKEKCKSLKKSLGKIRYLFGAQVELEDVFHQNGETKQWICIRAEESNAKHAKDYIVALTSPDETLILKNIWGHPLFTIPKRDSIEKTTCAVLSKGRDDSLEIKGTELSVMLAQSMIDDMFCKNVNVNDGSKDTGDVMDNGMTRKDFLDEIVDDDEEGQNDCILLETERRKEHGKTSLNQNNSAFAPLVCQTMAVSSLLGPQYNGGSFSDAAQHSSSSQHKYNSNTVTPNDYDPDHTPLWRPVSDNLEGPLHVRQSDRSKKIFSEKQHLPRNTSWPSQAEMGCNSVFASASAVSPSNKSGQYSTPNTGCLIVNQKGDGNTLKTNSNFPYQRSLQKDSGCEVEMEICGPDIVSKPHAGDKAKEQERYLRDLGRNLHYSEDDIEKGLNVYNMDNIIKPADFIETLNNVKTQRHGGDSHNKQKGRTKTLPDPAAAEVISDMDDSVICVGSVSKDVGSIQISSGVASAQADEVEDSDLDDSVICTEPISNKVRTITISSEDEVCVISPPAGTEQKRNRRRPRTRKEIADKSVANGEMSGHQAAVINVNPVTERVPVYDEDQRQRGLSPEPAPPRMFRRDLRYIIIDGSNVAMAHGNNRVFSVEGLRICINYFKHRGHDRITAFVPETRRYSGNQTPITGRQLLEKLNKDGYVKFTPARRCQGRGKMVVSYDDRYILNLAEKEEGIVVSNDQFRDLCQERHTYLRIVETRLLPFMFVGDHFMPPDDPLGRHGPHLDQFLRTNMVQEIYQPPTFPRPYNATGFPPSLTLEAPSARPKVLMEKYSNIVSKKPGKKNNSQGNGAKEDDVKSQPVRSRDLTEQLFEKLAQVFSEPQQKSKIRTVLNNHKEETDLHRLTNYCMSAIF